MPTDQTASISRHFKQVTDPRVERTRKHHLIDIITIAICAVICGADSWTEIEEFGKAKAEWLALFLELPNGIPSHDTFGRVFAALDPVEFKRGFVSWMRAVYQVSDGEIIAIDGKTLRRSHAKSLGKAAIHMVNAWAVGNHLVLAQEKVDDKSNEITAIPEVLSKLVLKGCIVTIDAIGCQKKIARQIVAQGGDYVISLKGNQGHLLEDVTGLFASAEQINFQGVTHDHTRTVSKGHGRIEVRECWTISDFSPWDCVRKLADWEKLQTVIKVRSERHIGDQVTEEIRYFIASVGNDASLALRAVREHWGIENSLHWVLDIVFREDESRIRDGYAAENMAVLRQIAVNLLKREKTLKVGIKAKRLRAGWDQSYLNKVLIQLVTA